MFKIDRIHYITESPQSLNSDLCLKSTFPISSMEKFNFLAFIHHLTVRVSDCLSELVRMYVHKHFENATTSENHFL